MRKIIFQCDFCENILSDGLKIKKPHLHLEFEQGGIATPNTHEGYRIEKAFNGIHQFCNPKCVKAFLEAKIIRNVR